MGPDLERLLEAAVERGVRRAMAELAHRPAVLTYQSAAKELSIGLTKLKEMVRDGEIGVCALGRRKGIPYSEISRVSRCREAEELERRTQPMRAARNVRVSSRAEADKIREAIRGGK